MSGDSINTGSDLSGTGAVSVMETGVCWKEKRLQRAQQLLSVLKMQDKMK